MNEPNTPTPVSYAAEVVADSSGKFCGNGLRFATEGEAMHYAMDLSQRWTLVTDYRVVPSNDPVTAAIKDNVLVHLPINGTSGTNNPT